VAEATKLVETAEKAGVPLLIGHHRRQNPMIQEAKKAIDSGRLGQVVSVHGTCWFCMQTRRLFRHFLAAAKRCRPSLLELDPRRGFASVSLRRSGFSASD
jgi:predicted dehydrogenase